MIVLELQECPRIGELIDWPIRNGLNRDELSTFFEWASSLNDFGPEIREFEGYSLIRY